MPCNSPDQSHITVPIENFVALHVTNTAAYCYQKYIKKALKKSVSVYVRKDIAKRFSGVLTQYKLTACKPSLFSTIHSCDVLVIKSRERKISSLKPAVALRTGEQTLCNKYQIFSLLPLEGEQLWLCFLLTKLSEIPLPHSQETEAQYTIAHLLTGAQMLIFITFNFLCHPASKELRGGILRSPQHYPNNAVRLAGFRDGN